MNIFYYPDHFEPVAPEGAADYMDAMADLAYEQEQAMRESEKYDWSCVEEDSEGFLKTLELFKAAEIDELDHKTWREFHMLPTIAEILRYSFFFMNPILKEAAYIARLQPDDPRVVCWQQEVDDDGYTQEELAERHNAIYPFFTREELEVYAAKKYLKEKGLIN
jgi:hypothetical protein